MRTRLVRRAPSMPAARISRATWSRPASSPARWAAFGELAGPVDAVVVLPERDQPWGQLRATDGSRRGRSVLGGVVGARGHLQHAADELDPEWSSFDDIGAEGVDERDYLRYWRSSSAPKKV